MGKKLKAIVGASYHGRVPLLTPLLLVLALVVACGAAATATPAPTATKAPAATPTPTAAALAAPTPTTAAPPTATRAPTVTAVPAAKPTPTPAPAALSKAKLDRLRIAVAPLGWDTNLTWFQSRSGQLDKRPALEYLIAIDQNTGAYIPGLATKWEVSPDGKNWTLTLRKGIRFIDSEKV